MIATTRTLDANHGDWLLLTQQQRDEACAWIKALGFDHYTISIEYDVIDCPLLRIRYCHSDKAISATYRPHGDDIDFPVVEIPITLPLPAWWQPEGTVGIFADLLTD